MPQNKNKRGQIKVKIKRYLHLKKVYNNGCQKIKKKINPNMKKNLRLLW